MAKRWTEISIVSRGARQQIGVAVALITIIPVLVAVYLFTGDAFHGGLWRNALLALILVSSIALGYVSICAYPLNIARLRRYMQDFVDGKTLEQVNLLKGMADIPAIEKCLALIVDQAREQVQRLEEEVEHRKVAESLKDDFISTVSHELRTPLAISKEGIGLLLDGIPGEINEKQRKVLTTSQRNIDRLARIINDLLDISKIEAGKMEIKKGRVNLDELLKQVVGNMEPLAAKKGLALAVESPPEPIDVYIDPDRIVQVVTNLVGNAIKFTQQGSVTVTCGRSEDKAVCSVRDTGRGVAEEDLPRLFEKFRQFGRTDGAGEKGTGLGLAIARNIIELHGGRMFAGSRLGEGTTFTFELPLFTPERALLDEIDRNLVREKAGGKNLTLVLVAIVHDHRIDADAAGRDFHTFYERFVAQSAVMRDSDLMMQRQDRQVLFLGEIREDSLALVSRRWVNLVRACFLEANPGVDVDIRHAAATLQKDGQNAEELLQHAENQLMRERQPVGSEKEGCDDASENGSHS